jgi:hypothetical protein
MHPRGRELRPRRRSKKMIIIIFIYLFIFFVVVACWKREEKNVQFSIPKIPKIPELHGLRRRSHEKKKVFLA